MRGRLHRVCALAILISAWGGSAVTPAHAEPLSAAAAVSLGKAADGQTIEVRGEAVGEALRAGAGQSWVNVLSDAVALGVVMDEADASAIPAFGAYEETGSTLLVRGVYNVACAEHGGDLDLHATSVEVQSAGSLDPEAPDWWELGLSAGLFGVALIAVGFRRRARRIFESG